MKKHVALFFIFLFALLPLSACEDRSFEDANKAYLSLLTSPEEITLYHGVFEPLLDVPEPDSVYGSIPSEFAQELLNDLRSQLGNLTTPLPDCADYACYTLVLFQENPENIEVPFHRVTFYFLEKDGAFAPKIYMEVASNKVWYAFDDSAGFVEKYLARMTEVE